MNIPFFGRFGTKYGTASATNPGVTDPEAQAASQKLLWRQTAGTSATKTVNSYGNGNSDFENHTAAIFRRKLLVLLKQSDLKYR